MPRGSGLSELSRLRDPKVSAHTPSPATWWPPGPLMRESEPGSSGPAQKRGRTAIHEPRQPWASVWTQIDQPRQPWAPAWPEGPILCVCHSTGGEPDAHSVLEHSACLLICGCLHWEGGLPWEVIRRGKSLPQPVLAGRPETLGTGCCLGSHPSHRRTTEHTQARVFRQPGTLFCIERPR